MSLLPLLDYFTGRMVVCLSWELTYQGSLLEYEICNQKQLVGIMALLLLSCETLNELNFLTQFFHL